MAGMDRKTQALLEKLGKAVEGIADSIAQLQLDLAKMSARLAAMDDRLAGLARRPDRGDGERPPQAPERDLDLERQVFAKFATPRRAREEGEAAGESGRTARAAARKPAARPRKSGSTARRTARKRAR
jgi:hypothetical protein